MSTWNDAGKLEAAMKAVADALTLPLYGDEKAIVVNTGQDDDALDLPAIVCEALGGVGEEIVKGTGNFRTRAVVRVTSSATISIADHRTRAATVFDAFLQDNIKTTLGAAIADFYVFEVNHSAPEPTRKDPRDNESFVWVSELPLEVIWCGSDIS